LFHVTGLVMVFTFLTPERRQAMKWTKPQYQDLRFGFEITMYISAR
jgi:coenzyme PQQ precursor peptide PqqA